MKFKNQKWIARELGIENWEEMEVDTCDTYQNIFYSQAIQLIQLDNLKFYQNNGCQVALDETITTGTNYLVLTG